jgi:hypothetical protein
MPAFNKWIQNVTSTMDFSKGVVWELPINIPSSMQSVEAIVRQVTYVADASFIVDNCLMIWCNINNGIIASVTGDASTSIAPQTTISIPHSFVGPIKFQLYAIDANGKLTSAFGGNPAGKIAITMDIIGIV